MLTRGLRYGFVMMLFAAMAWAGPFITGAEAKKMVDEGALLLDVRTVGEFNEKHIEGAVNIPIQDLEKRLAEVGDKKRPVVVYCRSGKRSEQAKVILDGAGWQKVENLGGIDNWDSE